MIDRSRSVLAARYLICSHPRSEDAAAITSHTSYPTSHIVRHHTDSSPTALVSDAARAGQRGGGAVATGLSRLSIFSGERTAQCLEQEQRAAALQHHAAGGHGAIGNDTARAAAGLADGAHDAGRAQNFFCALRVAAGDSRLRHGLCAAESGRRIRQRSAKSFRLASRQAQRILGSNSRADRLQPALYVSDPARCHAGLGSVSRRGRPQPGARPNQRALVRHSSAASTRVSGWGDAGDSTCHRGLWRGESDGV